MFYCYFCFLTNTFISDCPISHINTYHFKMAGILHIHTQIQVMNINNKITTLWKKEKLKSMIWVIQSKIL